MRKCSFDSLNKVFEAISSAMLLYLPVDSEQGASYQKWEKGSVYSQKLNTVRSPKDFFFPQTEDLMAFKTQGKEIEVIDTRAPAEDFAVFGIRACDAKSFEVLDNVFLAEPVDTYYKSRREHGIIMTMACSRPTETCFCQTFGIDAAEPCGDISCYTAEGDVYFEAKTEKGTALLEKLASVTEEADTAAVEKEQEKIREILSRLPLAGLTTDGFGGDKTLDLFDAPEWQTLSQSCLGCGTCTFVCPTCQCYDIKDFDTGHGIVRYRCWDSCMYSDFTKMAHGNIRNSQLERFRQRFMHKLVYYPANNDGLYSCVGCGRCLSKCPISMNIVKVMKTLGGKADV